MAPVADDRRLTRPHSFPQPPRMILEPNRRCRPLLSQRQQLILKLFPLWSDVRGCPEHDAHVFQGKMNEWTSHPNPAAPIPKGHPYFAATTNAATKIRNVTPPLSPAAGRPLSVGHQPCYPASSGASTPAAEWGWPWCWPGFR